MAYFKDLTDLLSSLENVTSRNKTVDLLANFFNELKPKDVRISSYLILERIGPRYRDIDIGISEKLSVKAVSLAFDEPEKKVKRQLNRSGDIGDAALFFNKKQKSKTTLSFVYKRLWDIRNSSGKGGQKQKINLLANLLRQTSSLESKYIARIGTGKLRIDVADLSLLDAFAVAFSGSIKNREKVEDGYNQCTDIGKLGEVLSRSGLDGIKRLKIVLGRLSE